MSERPTESGAEPGRAAEPGVVHWLTGLAGVGKTTVARLLAERLAQRGRRVVLLDGDELRATLFPDAGYRPEQRLELARRYARLCGLLAQQGIDVVCATISLFPEVWQHNRQAFAAYREVLLRAPARVRQARKPQLYGASAPASGAREADVVGRDAPAPEPPSPDVVLENDGARSPAELADELLARLDALPPFSTGTDGAHPDTGGERCALAGGTKAELLEHLAPRLRSARVLPQVRFTVGAWRADPRAVLDTLERRGWLALPVIVRSSARAEDHAGSSQAGRFRSIGGCRGAQAVTEAIDAVVESLAVGSQGLDEQVFVQPWLQDVALSGVVLSRDPTNASHYRVVGYDTTSGTTDAITSGRAEDRRTWYHHADAPESPPAELADVLALVAELEELLAPDESQALDVEFAVTAEGVLTLLQVRAVRVPEAPGAGRQAEAGALARIRERVAALGQPHPDLYGSRAVLGCMPDWNPAEILGARPRPLALSLYRELVTDSIWAYQRSNYGYRNLRSFPLLVSLGGLPYVDVRVSFCSFVPADLEPELGRRLVDEYLRRLLASPRDHDKVEFAIVYSCYTLDLPQRLAPLLEHGFEQDDLEQLATSLKALTNRIIAEPTALFRRDLEKLEQLERRRRALQEDPSLDRRSRLYWLLEDGKRYGTLPFAGIARAAFIAVQLLDSLVAVGILSDAERARFLGSLQSVRSAMDDDLARLPREAFLARYGHLRPGTYDVTSPRYDQAPEAYFDWSRRPSAESAAPRFELARDQRRRLDRLLREHGLEHDAGSLLAFLAQAIEGREAAKFAFSHNLSDALELLAELAAEHGFSREDLAFADVEVVRHLYAECEDPRAVLGDSIRSGRRRFAVTRQLTLPPLVTGPADVSSFALPVCEPSYVTLERADGPVVELGAARGGDLPGAIVLMPSADPGHDWIFSHAIAGFVTMYGGYNSHMAIRAGELGIPAVIGAGEALYRRWSAARALRLDCLGRTVEVLR